MPTCSGRHSTTILAFGSFVAFVGCTGGDDASRESQRSSATPWDQEEQGLSWWWEGHTAPIDDVSNPDNFGDIAFEKQFEQRYWDILGRSDAPALDGWVRAAEVYVRESRSPRTGRFFMLIAGATTALFREGNYLRYFDATSSSKSASRLIPRHLNTVAFEYGLSSFQNLALGREQAALAAIDRMIASPGTEEKVAAALTLGLATNNRYLPRALALLEDCRTDVCNHTTTLAPSKPIGMLLTLAELYAKGGDDAKFEEALGRAERLADVEDWPFKARFRALRSELPAKKAKWDEGASSIGLVALPLASFTEFQMCAGCHRGAKVKDSDYEVGSDSHDVAN